MMTYSALIELAHQREQQIAAWARHSTLDTTPARAIARRARVTAQLTHCMLA